MVCNAGVHAAPFGEGSKIAGGKWHYPAGFLGKVYDWKFNVMLPSSRNPQGFPGPGAYWNAGLLFETGHTSHTSGHA